MVKNRPLIYYKNLKKKTFEMLRSEISLNGPIYHDLDHNVSKVSKSAKIRNRYNQVPHLTQDTNGKVTNSQ